MRIRHNCEQPFFRNSPFTLQDYLALTRRKDFSKQKLMEGWKKLYNGLQSFVIAAGKLSGDLKGYYYGVIFSSFHAVPMSSDTSYKALFSSPVRLFHTSHCEQVLFLDCDEHLTGSGQ